MPVWPARRAFIGKTLLPLLLLLLAKGVHRGRQAGGAAWLVSRSAGDAAAFLRVQFAPVSRPSQVPVLGRARASECAIRAQGLFAGELTRMQGRGLGAFSCTASLLGRSAQPCMPPVLSRRWAFSRTFGACAGIESPRTLMMRALGIL